MNDNIIKINYISCACNRVPNSADCGRNGLLCYGACNSIVIRNLSLDNKLTILQTLSQHTDRVNVVKWIKTTFDRESELISASSDGTAIIWSKKGDKFRATSVLKIDDPLSVCHAIYINQATNNNLFICTGSINGDFQLWMRNSEGETYSFQRLSFDKKLPIQAHISFLPQTTKPLLAIALDDSTIELFSQNDTESTFFKITTLIGHEDWITCIDCIEDNSGESFLATGSQDHLIRLWKISLKKYDNLKDELGGRIEKFTIDKREYEVVLESILAGHEGWIYGVTWHPAIQVNGDWTQPMKLLSCSLDKSMIIWEIKDESGLWLESVRVGEIGGNSSGFYGCKFGAEGKEILAHGYQGSFHIWKYSEILNSWTPYQAPSGHFGQVVDLCWEPKGRFLITTSTDQTTRIHGCWSQNPELWCEIARPQIHGYDMSCLAILSPDRFASGAEEKVIRIFTSPLTFKLCLEKISFADDFPNVKAETVSVPALGLMNKAIIEQESEENGSKVTKLLTYDSPPVEEELIQYTLWPEEQKLYGHGYEIFSMAARHDGTLLATACKSSNAEYAAIIIWDSKSWTQRQKLLAHQLTVTQLAFSPNDDYLLSVSRDRRWSLFKYEAGIYNLLIMSAKKNALHGRIIWCCAWTGDSKYFATGSRDGKIGIWNKEVHLSAPDVASIKNFEIKDKSVTALAFAPIFQSSEVYILAVGFENGEIVIKKINMKDSNLNWYNESLTLDSSFAHNLAVKRLQFRPRYKIDESSLQLASCGSDNMVKIYNIDIVNLQRLLIDNQ